ncbi:MULTISPECIES: molybdate ABC transporter substrate-binding protein [unclassified Sphingomonas]|uniref:molybdate ABC transporter substrate-binding protein n=1 Tax=unclassified Sphingomonas TaxID=196159 RepID=UPI0006F8940E|nr:MULTISPECIES: molybdate ABC transporter substrate-binding protein [unclassified Sphingomonas]KQX18021.1 molybdate ABC transporter substrate-binding protein [Sphingomonas sp. Root1294]KQY70946.1 molybdate ABC transporter substrate-binding protein [Sphingomonas sp. Root50]KRB91556.1 molybdate ABC transporter substrate-binding protein [Sphingomonas sp. Root720]
MSAIVLALRWLALLGAMLSAPLLAAETQVAVAANFSEPAKAIAAAFERATGHKAVLAFGASGAFYTQISHGAPFEVFLSADAERPTKADQDGLAVSGTRFTYAIGKLVLYSTIPGTVDASGAVLKKGGFDKIAIADPATAPYGAAAVETMRSLGVYDRLKPKIVTGSSIAQAYQFTSTGAAQLGFVALSQVIVIPGGSRWIVPAKLHAPIDQQAVLLKTGAQNPAAKAFLAFLKGPTALAIIRRYGYATR